MRWLAASPLLGSLQGCATGPKDEVPTGGGASDARLSTLVGSAEEALDVFDLEAAARTRIPHAHWGYLITGTDGEATLRANREALEALQLRARRLVGVDTIDTGVSLFGGEWPTPIIVAPAGSQRAYHPEGELATARAAQELGHLQVLSTVASIGVEAVNEARGEPVWYQLYPTSNWAVTEGVVKRVERAGCPVLVLTVDLPSNSNRETQARWARIDDRTCDRCHTAGGRAPPVKPMFQGTGYRPQDFRSAGLTWDFIGRLRTITDMPIVLKGIVTAEDAALCVRHGVDGVWVSNHGGRAEDSGRATIEALPEVAAAVQGRLPIIMDSGIRRGTDILKALALGADAVAVGRPYLWGLGAFGQEGVARALTLLRQELEITMRLVGAPSVREVGPEAVAWPRR